VNTSRRKPRLSISPVSLRPAEMSAEELIDAIEQEMKLVERYERDLQRDTIPQGTAMFRKRPASLNERPRDAA
jgi:hypothetical protein